MFDTRIPVYGILILTALIANIIVVVSLSKRSNLNKREIIGLLLYENVGIIGGAKVLTFLQNYKALGGRFDFISLGFTAYGAAIGALVFLLLFSWQFKKPLKEILYVFMPPLPLMYGIGKIGCFLAGCCYGIRYDGWGSVIYEYSKSAPESIPLFPVQIVEALVFIGLFAYIMIRQKKQLDLKTVGIGLILCGIAKFSLDFLRDSHAGQILSSSQMISAIVVLIGTGILILNREEKESFIN